MVPKKDKIGVKSSSKLVCYKPWSHWTINRRHWGKRVRFLILLFIILMWNSSDQRQWIVPGVQASLWPHVTEIFDFFLSQILFISKAFIWPFSNASLHLILFGSYCKMTSITTWAWASKNELEIFLADCDFVSINSWQMFQASVGAAGSLNCAIRTCESRVWKRGRMRSQLAGQVLEKN